MGRIRYIATNPAYSGGLRYRGQFIEEGAVTPIVDRELAATVRAILADDARRTSPGPAPRHLSTMLSRCGATVVRDGRSELCGAAMVKRARSYQCQDATDHVSIQPPILDGIVRDAVATAFLSTGGDLFPDPRRASLVALDAELSRLAVLEAEARDLRREGLLSAAGYRDELAHIAAQRTAVESSIERTRAESSATTALSEVADFLLEGADRVIDMTEWDAAKASLLERFDALDIDRRRDTARALIEVIVMPGRHPRRVQVRHKVATHLNPEEQVDDHGGESTPRDPSAPRRRPRAEREAV
jgi:hypothetical protein